WLAERGAYSPALAFHRIEQRSAPFDLPACAGQLSDALTELDRCPGPFRDFVAAVLRLAHGVCCSVGEALAGRPAEAYACLARGFAGLEELEFPGLAADHEFLSFLSTALGWSDESTEVVRHCCPVTAEHLRQ